jgi:hypothetical protein
MGVGMDVKGWRSRREKKNELLLLLGRMKMLGERIGCRRRGMGKKLLWVGKGGGGGGGEDAMGHKGGGGIGNWELGIGDVVGSRER